MASVIVTQQNNQVVVSPTANSLIEVIARGPQGPPGPPTFGSGLFVDDAARKAPAASTLRHPAEARRAGPQRTGRGLRACENTPPAAAASGRPWRRGATRTPRPSALQTSVNSRSGL